LSARATAIRRPWLSTADAVIHDPGINEAILEPVKHPRYREAA